ncbi:FKBP-type peptidyl-prolyl cis-trans isomerase [Thiobacter aerophilum]|uniref:Peptidyl-prolyl cis-trans isomerase n=1 Tax=Thiobacter aerophilum TaxID=3121275 RepID=A0ABV0EGP6_9BURK
MSEPVVSKNKAVYITYSILTDGGEVYEQSDLPIGYVHGADSGLFEAVEEALAGAHVGDRREVTLTPEEAFGPHDPRLTYTDDIENVPPEYRRLGAEVEFENEKGESLTFRVTRMENGKLTIDANHPLAGKTVNFVVNVVAIRDATPEEIAQGRPFDGTPPTLH